MTTVRNASKTARLTSNATSGLASRAPSQPMRRSARSNRAAWSTLRHLFANLGYTG